MTQQLQPGRHGVDDMLAGLSARALPTAFADAELERAYRHHVFEDELGPSLIRVLGALLVTGVAFVAVDRFVVPDAFGLAVAMRLGVITPLWGVLLVLALKGRVDERRALVWPLVGTFVVVGSFYVLALVADPPGSWLYLTYVAAFPLAGPALGRWPTPVAIWVNASVMLGAVAVLAARPPGTAVTVFVVVVVAVGAVFGVLTGAVVEQFSRRSYLQQLVIEAEERRAHTLLLNVLPEAIADRLATDPSFIAEQHESVTVLFADIVGFTETVARYGAEAVIGPLNELFSRFDALTDRHGVEKVKTIGDAYMVVGGLPTPRPDHADAVLAMATDMLDEAATVAVFLGEPIRLRIGVHTGPVVAGVIGTRKFAYDLWGDTVNVASRMESHGEPGRIQVTSAVRDALQGDVPMSHRGTIDVRGRGPMPTWWVG